MFQRHVVPVALTLIFAVAAAGADNKGIHIPAGKTTSWAWVRNDAAGYRWDIYSSGYVSNGTDSAYSGGMQLRVNGASFSWSSTGRINKQVSDE